jgi:hypothetical protein
MVTVAVCQSDGPRPVRLLQPDGARSACLISYLTMRSLEAWRRAERTSVTCVSSTARPANLLHMSLTLAPAEMVASPRRLTDKGRKPPCHTPTPRTM